MSSLGDSPLLQVANEIKALRSRIQALETQDVALGLPLDGSIVGANNQAQDFTFGVISPVVDYPLLDPTNGSHFVNNSSSYPAGWTQADAPQTTNTNDAYSFWSIVGSSGDAAWKFRKQTPFDIGALAANGFKSFHVGPLIIKESLPTANLNYYFGIYRDNAGAIDENTFLRININWLAASSLWQIRAERKDGITQTNGTYYTLARVPVGPLWLRLTLKNSTNRDVYAYMGPVPFAVMQMQMMNSNVGSGVTWGQVWWQFHSSRGAGPDDRVMVGGIDYSAAT